MLALPSQQCLIRYSIPGLSRTVLESVAATPEGNPCSREVTSLWCISASVRSQSYTVGTFAPPLTVSPLHISSAMTFCGPFCIPSVPTP